MTTILVDLLTLTCYCLYIYNVLAVFSYELSEVTPLWIARCIGIAFPPLGIILGAYWHD